MVRPYALQLTCLLDVPCLLNETCCLVSRSTSLAQFGWFVQDVHLLPRIKRELAVHFKLGRLAECWYLRCQLQFAEELLSVDQWLNCSEAWEQ